MRTHKEIAQRLKQLEDEDDWAGVVELIYELDPPPPEPGTVVWWRDAEGLGEWNLGSINNNRKVEFFGAWKELDFERLQIKPAHILGPGQVAVDVPPVSGWPDWAGAMEWQFIRPVTFHDRLLITRPEAEAMEAGDGK